MIQRQPGDHALLDHLLASHPRRTFGQIVCRGHHGADVLTRMLKDIWTELLLELPAEAEVTVAVACTGLRLPDRALAVKETVWAVCFWIRVHWQVRTR